MRAVCRHPASHPPSTTATTIATVIKVGRRAPDFSLVDNSRVKRTLSQYRGDKNVVLAFYVLAFTADCQEEMRCFAELEQEFAAAATQVLGISVDPFPSLGAWSRELGLWFPLLSDWPRYEASRKYGVYNSERNTADRVTFLVDRGGIIRAAIDDARDLERHARESLAVAETLPARQGDNA